MLQESKTNELEYQRLSKEEMDKRGILGRLVGVCADIINPTRNGRKYPEKLWENVFNDPIMKERIDNGVCYGELGHPADREETDMEKICVCLAEQPKKGKDGKLRAVFDILNTPNGRILKSLCDYGSTLGISSRGSGDLETDFDGQESVNPDTYNCEGFDIVLVPAVKAARLQYVSEALDKKRYNKTLREKLTESIQKETEEHQKVINESLSVLGVDLTEANDKSLSKNDFYFANEKQEFDDKPQELFALELQKLSEETLEQVLDSVPVGSKIHNIYDVWWTKHSLKDGDTPIESVVEKRQSIKQNYSAPLATKYYDVYWSVSGSEYRTYDLIKIILGKDKYKIVSDGQTFNFDESLNESQYKDYEVQPTDSGTLVRDSKGDIVQEVSTDDEATEWINDNSTDESLTEAQDIGDSEGFYAVQRRLDQKETPEMKSMISTISKEIKAALNANDVSVDYIIASDKINLATSIITVSDNKLTSDELSAIADQLTQLLIDNYNAKNIDVWQKISLKNETVQPPCYYNHINAKFWVDGMKIDEQLNEAHFAGYNYTYGVHAHPSGPDILLGGSNDLEQAEEIGITQVKSILDNPFMSAQEKSDYINTIYISDDNQEIELSVPKFEQFVETSLDSLSSSQVQEDIENKNDYSAAVSDGAIIEQLQKLLSTNKELQDKIIDLQEKLSVSYTKEISLKEELAKSQADSDKLSENLTSYNELNEQLTSVKTSEQTFKNKCKKLSESIERKNEKVQQLVEQLSKKDAQLKALQEQVKASNDSIEKSNATYVELTEKYETLTKDYQQMKEHYSKQLSSQNDLVEKYRDVAVKSVNKYIDTQAIRLGVTSEEIKNRLPESYSFKDIDKICENLQEYKLNMSDLPFATPRSKMTEGLKIKATNVDTRTLVPMEEDLDDLTLRLAGLK